MEKVFNILIGLNDKTMVKSLNKDDVLSTTADKLLSIGIKGFNVSELVGFWEGKKELSLKFSFINTFNIDEDKLKKAIGELREAFNQESILLEKGFTDFAFI